MSSDPIADGFMSQYTEKVQSLILLETKAKNAPKDARLSYESVRDLTVGQLLAKSDTRCEPQHRVSNSLNELAGAMTSLLCSRHYLAGAAGTPTQASRDSVQQIASGIVKMLTTVPASAQWVPVTAFMELVTELKKPI